MARPIQPRLTAAALGAAAVVLCGGAAAQAGGKEGSAVLPPVTVTAPRDFVEKSYRRMISGMDLFEREHAYAPQAPLRFKLLPRKRDTNMRGIELEVIGRGVDIEVPIAADNTFALPRDRRAFDADAIVTPNRRSRSMTWRAEIRTPGLPPGLPPGTRRLGDLRLECRVGLQAGLVSNNGSLISKMMHAITDDPERYCGERDARYLFFADRPLFSVTLVAGARREVLPVSRLYAAASEDAGLPYDLPFCDCEVLVDRTYYAPLGDRSWPDDTLLEFDYMDDP